MTLVGFDLPARMLTHRVPGVAIAILAGSTIVDQFSCGVPEVGSVEPLLEVSIFQVASISKPLSGVLAMQQIRDGLYSLETPANDLLTNWRLPENDLTRDRPVTVRDLLGHTSGIDVPTFHGYTDPLRLPSLVKVMDGIPPATSAPVRVLVRPGTEFRYSSGGYCVLQQLIEDQAKIPFSRLFSERLLEPLGMTNSTFSHPPDSASFPHISHGHKEDGTVVPGGFHLYPEMAAAALWSTATDLAKAALELQSCLRGESDLLLPAELAHQMMTPHLEPVFGLGFALYDKDGPYFGHMGNTEGYRSLLISHQNNGNGAIILTNSANGDALMKEIINTIAHRHQWENFHW